MSCPNDEEVHLTINLNHPFVVGFIGRDQERLHLYILWLFADALVERALRRRAEPVTPRAQRVLKDQFLRRLRAGEDD
jgi:hypothetical protein